jgi:hypothetical protein
MHPLVHGFSSASALENVAAIKQVHAHSRTKCPSLPARSAALRITVVEAGSFGTNQLDFPRVGHAIGRIKNLQRDQVILLVVIEYNSRLIVAALGDAHIARKMMLKGIRFF